MSEENHQLATDDLKDFPVDDVVLAIRQSPTGELTESDLTAFFSMNAEAAEKPKPKGKRGAK